MNHWNKTSSHKLVLSNKSVHIWKVNFGLNDFQIKNFYQTLSKNEIERASKFHFERDRTLYITNRGILRQLLGSYLHKNPRRLHFYYNKYGKPALIPNQNQTKIQFNISHSGQIGLFAFTENKNIGVDVEQISDMHNIEQIARRFFSNKENHDLNQVPSSKKKEAFYNCWTRKEAFIKAIGVGLSLPLDSFDVSLLPGHSAKILRLKHENADINWTIKALTPLQGYAGAVAVAGKGLQFKYYEWMPKTVRKGNSDYEYQNPKFMEP